MAGISSTKGDNPGVVKYQKSTLEQAENEANQERRAADGFQRYPLMMKKPNGLSKLVANEQEESDAKAKGWLVKLKPVEETVSDATLVSQMPAKQAIEFIGKAKIHELAAIEADEASHGARATVMAAIEKAKDDAK